jgi:hypothetical protein
MYTQLPKFSDPNLANTFEKVMLQHCVWVLSMCHKRLYWTWNQSLSTLNFAPHTLLLSLTTREQLYHIWWEVCWVRVLFLLGVLHAGAWMKNTLWARPRLSVSCCSKQWAGCSIVVTHYLATVVWDHISGRATKDSCWEHVQQWLGDLRLKMSWDHITEKIT